MKPSALQTERLRLRAPEPKDIHTIFAFENDTEGWEYSLQTGPYSLYQIKKYIIENQNDLFADRQQRFIIELSSGEAAGIIDLFNYDPRHHRAELGIGIFPPYRRQGIAKESIRLIEDHCFRYLGLRQLFAYIQSDNTPCLQMFQSLDYQQAGILKDWIRIGKKYKDVYIIQKLG